MRKIRIVKNQAHPDGYYIKYNGETIGKFNILTHESDKLTIDAFKIYPLFRNKGFGTAAVKKIIKLYEDSGLPLFLIVDFDNEIAQRLYQKCGFKFTGEILEFYPEFYYEMKYEYKEKTK